MKPLHSFFLLRQTVVDIYDRAFFRRESQMIAGTDFQCVEGSFDSGKQDRDRIRRFRGIALLSFTYFCHY